jgi:phosphoglycolate phosphatase
MMRIVFDLDGTLVDSAPSLCAAGAALLAELGRPPVDVETYKTFVGRGVLVQVERLLTHTGGVPGGDAAPHFERFKQLYDPLAKTRPYAGAVEAVAVLAAEGWRIGVCTQKPEAPARRILDALGFDAVEALGAGDSIPGVLKPDPRMFALATPPGDGPILYVGDSETDAETAANAGAPFLLHLNGYRKGPIASAAAFADFADLPRLAAQVLKQGRAA